VDADKYNILSDQHSKCITIGWSGSQSTLEYLELMSPILKKLKEQIEFRFLVICNYRPEFEIESMDFFPWNEATEVEGLSQIQIGIMPAKDDAWSEGKCGFKLIQYMALGTPAVASPVGVNKTIIEQDRNGYLCESEEEWVAALSDLVSDQQKRIEWGKKGREKILKEFTTQSNRANFLSLFS
jgi:glycosyltransferase involved in cell wall biosynthesis